MVLSRRLMSLVVGLPVLLVTQLGLEQGRNSQPAKPGLGSRTWVGRYQEVEQYLRTAECVAIENMGPANPQGVPAIRRCVLRPGGPVARMAWKPLAPGAHRVHRGSPDVHPLQPARALGHETHRTKGRSIRRYGARPRLHGLAGSRPNGPRVRANAPTRDSSSELAPQVSGPSLRGPAPSSARARRARSAAPLEPGASLVRRQPGSGTSPLPQRRPAPTPPRTKL